MAISKQVESLQARVAELEQELRQVKATKKQPALLAENKITVSDIEVAWDVQKGRCTFENLPVAMMWVDTTLAGLLSGVQAMVGAERFALALQSEGRNSVEADWSVISQFDTFEEGFKAIANVAAVAGWGRWELVGLDKEKKSCRFRVYDSWEGRFQKTLGVRWGCNMLAGKLAGYVGRLFKENCWADQTRFIAQGDEFDEFIVSPSPRNLEMDAEQLLTSDKATRADMAVALERLKTENEERRRVETELKAIQVELEQRVLERTEALARANKEIKVSESRFRSIVDASPMGMHIYEMTDKGALIFQGANPVADKIVGFEHAQFVGKTLEEIFPPLQDTDIPEKYREVCRTGKSLKIDKVDYEYDEVKGTYEVHAFKTSPGTIAVLFLDISDRIQAEQEREKLLAELYRSKKMEALGLLAGGVAHDLNNILSGVVGFPELLIHRLPKDSPMLRPLQAIENSGLRAAAVVQDLLTIARGAATTRQIVDFNALIEEYLQSPEYATLRRTHPAVAIRTNLDPALLCVSCSSVHIRKVLMNLVSNAIEAQHNEGNVLVSTENRYVDAPLKGYDSVDVGEYVVLKVSDNGPGIADADMERIFEPFYTKKRMGRSGTGLGLAVVWNCVKDHNGYINVTSSPAGTVFEIYLRAERKSPEIEARYSSIDVTNQGNGQLILVVDDEESQRDLTYETLSYMGYKVHTSPSGAEAFEFVKSNKVDLVVLDMIMPSGLSGRETYEGLLELQPGLPAIIVSGFAETDEVRKTQEMGAGPFLKKPFSLTSLAEAVHCELQNPSILSR